MSGVPSLPQSTATGRNKMQMENAASRTNELAAAAERLVDLFMAESDSDESVRGARMVVLRAAIERVSKVWRETPDGTPAPAVPPTRDGPTTPNLLYYQGKRFELAPSAWRIVAFLWAQPEWSVLDCELIQHLWGKDDEVGEGAIKSVLYRANTALLEQNCPLEVRRKRGHVLLCCTR
jgi:hypothetical protein